MDNESKEYLDDVRLLAFVEEVLTDAGRKYNLEDSFCPLCLILADTVPLADYDFQARLRQEFMKGSMKRLTRRVSAPISRRFAIMVLCLVIAVGGTLSTSCGQTFAQDVLELFTRAESNTLIFESTVPVPTENREFSEGLTLTLQATPTFDAFADFQERFSLSIVEAEALAGFDIKIPTNLHNGYKFWGAHYDLIINSVTQMYVMPVPGPMMDSVVFITQSRGAFSDEGKIGSDAEVETVIIGGAEGQYVKGGWVTFSSETPAPQPGDIVTKEFTWEKYFVPMQRMRWQADGFFFEITVQGSDTQKGFLFKQDMIVLANGLAW